MIKQKPCIRIKLTGTNPDIFSSKAGGLGYIPHDGNFPVDEEGKIHIIVRIKLRTHYQKIKRHHNQIQAQRKPYLSPVLFHKHGNAFHTLSNPSWYALL